MSVLFEELDYRDTPIGELSLRRRRKLATDLDVYEIKLGEEFLMSSLFTTSEIALADLGLAELTRKGNIDVVVGGLGLGYTAQAVLAHNAVSSLIVVETIDAVIDWHTSGLLPLGAQLTSDKRCSFVHGDFFELAASRSGFDPEAPARLFDAILVDIDHSPDLLLTPDNASFYQQEGLERLRKHLNPGGVFGLWSNDLPKDDFTARLSEVFSSSRAERVSFPNPLQARDFTQTIYLAQNIKGSKLAHSQ